MWGRWRGDWKCGSGKCHHCYLLLLFPLLHIPPVRSTSASSTPAISTPAVLSCSFHSCIFHSRIFSAGALKMREWKMQEWKLQEKCSERRRSAWPHWPKRLIQMLFPILCDKVFVRNNLPQALAPDWQKCHWALSNRSSELGAVGQWRVLSSAALAFLWFWTIVYTSVWTDWLTEIIIKYKQPDYHWQNRCDRKVQWSSPFVNNRGMHWQKIPSFHFLCYRFWLPVIRSFHQFVVGISVRRLIR